MRPLAHRQQKANDHGFTLVELLIVIAIMGIITVPLAQVVIQYLTVSDATTARLVESNDAQITAAYFAQDVSSLGNRNAADVLVQSVETAAPYSSGLYPCGGAGTPNAVVRLAWDDFTTSTSQQVITVAYVVKAVPGLSSELHRLRCVGASSTPVSDTLLAHDLDPSTPPTVACVGTSGVNCAAAPAVPVKITLTLTMKAAQNNGAVYVVTLIGQRRQS